MNAVALPLAIFLYQTSESRRTRLLTVTSIVLSGLSIAYSGTRGALFTALVYAVVAGRRRLISQKGLSTLLIAVLGVALFAPADLKNRYLSSFGFLSDKHPESSSDKIARGSAESRMHGLLDGMALGSRRPLLGYGPEASPRARLEVRETYGELALHNLYGQVIAELGWGGFALWCCVVLAAASGLLSVEAMGRALDPERRRDAMAMRELLLHSLLVVLVYGLASHDLYDYKWLFIFGTQVALVSLIAAARRDATEFPTGQAPGWPASRLGTLDCS
jgi:O-antigen ligase